MQQTSLNFFHRNFASEQMNFLYTGEFSDEHTERFVELNNSQFMGGDQFKKQQRRAAFLIAECFQNIVRHSDLSNRDSYFHIKNNVNKFGIISGNVIRKDIVPSLKKQLEQLNKLTSSELKEVYRKTLFNGEFSSKGGAGLGLIEMARRTKNKLSFRFSEVNKIKSYFYFQLLLDSVSEVKNTVKCNFDSDILLRNKMVDDDLFLVYNGITSTQVTSSLLKIIGNTFESPKQTIVFITLMKIIERFSRELNSAPKTNSVTLLVGQNFQEYKMEVSYVLTELQSKRLLQVYKTYQSLSQENLVKEHTELSKFKHISYLDTCKLSVIELLKSCAKLNVNIQPEGNNFYFVHFTAIFDKIKEYPESITKNANLKLVSC